MNPLEWARQRKRAKIMAQSYRRGANVRQTNRLDDNELGKYIATLRHREVEQLRKSADGLARENNQEPVSAFGKRSGNEYLGRFKVLRAHVISPLPPSWNDEDAMRGLRWLKRLLDIEDSDREQHRQGQDNLLRWLLHGESLEADAQVAPPLPEPSTSPRPPQGRQGEGKKREKKKDRR